ncbi:dienelactone hydrolase family protein [Thermomonas sp.]|uniref:dienelactone hydrolase family protein n=1 Tax=Thermomonas sp. TaxID=1971895 RepID=UPI002487AB9E|nr:dienelactone hydrolase family protein [Thermomonas sp.]MDI1251941.1 dienelactone hydrolase family protein [Thermomonas sp.]
MLATAPVFAKMQAKPVEWHVGNDHFSGYVVYDDAGKAKRPGLVMVPDWYGVTDSALEKAKHIAGQDYVVLLTDVYGKGVRPKSNDEALAQVKKLNGDDMAWRARINKAVDVLKAQAGSAPLDASKIGALGYCFGGSTVLELARSGADIAGVVTFHGGLSTPMPAKPGSIKASVLVLNGADDKGAAGDIVGFQQEMNEAGADWQFVNFSGAVHCFALPTANRPGCMYNERAATRGELMMHNFFAERFAAK